MSNEASLTQTLQDELKKRGFEVIKHTDRFLKGVPDTSASRNHKTIWMEFKIVKVKHHLVVLNFNKIIKKEDMVQLARMVKMEEKALAFYILFQTIEGKGHQMHVLLPNQILFSVKNDKAIPLGTAVTMQEVGEWV